jgi:xylulokinase
MPSSQSDLYLGLDLSTQQLKYTVINHDHDIIAEAAVHFDNDLPEFKTTNGAIAQGDTVTSPTLMWVKALDILLSRLSQHSDIKVEDIKGISGAGQVPIAVASLHLYRDIHRSLTCVSLLKQHGSVFWKKEGLEILGSLSVSRTLEDQLEDAFSISQSPIWQDASTTDQCKSLENLVGGPQGLADLTGSKGYERFTGNQIAKVRIRMVRTDFSATRRLTNQFKGVRTK